MSGMAALRAPRRRGPPFEGHLGTPEGMASVCSSAGLGEAWLCPTAQKMIRPQWSWTGRPSEVLLAQRSYGPWPRALAQCQERPV